MNDDMITVTIPRPSKVMVGMFGNSVILAYSPPYSEKYRGIETIRSIFQVPILYHWLGAEADAP